MLGIGLEEVRCDLAQVPRKKIEEPPEKLSVMKDLINNQKENVID